MTEERLDVYEHPEIWDKFKEYAFAQIEELMSEYGPIDVLWLDGGQVRSSSLLRPRRS
jgi:alpha-L-fucosidase